MGNIIEFGKKYEETLEGAAICLCCKHNWIHVAPAATSQIDCPVCGSSKGMFKHFCDRPKESHWKCNCGSYFFSVTTNGIYCIQCSNWARPYE